MPTSIAARGSLLLRLSAVLLLAVVFAAVTVRVAHPRPARTEPPRAATPAAPSRAPWATQGFRDDETLEVVGVPADIDTGG